MAREQIKLRTRLSVGGPEWKAVKEWMEIEREHLISKLINASTHDDSMKYRGAIELIKKLLQEEDGR